MKTITEVLYRLNTETNFIFEDYSSKNDPCELLHSEDEDISIYLPNTENNTLENEEEFNTFLVIINDEDVLEDEDLDLVINFLKDYEN